MDKLRIGSLAAMLGLLMVGPVAGAPAAAAKGQHVKTHPTAARIERRSNHHGSGVANHRHHPRHARHARTHGMRLHRGNR